MPNFTRDESLRSGLYDHPGYLLKKDVQKVFRMADGNTIVLDNKDRLYNVHPCVNYRHNRKLGKNEEMPF